MYILIKKLKLLIRKKHLKKLDLVRPRMKFNLIIITNHQSFKGNQVAPIWIIFLLRKNEMGLLIQMNLLDSQ